MLPCASRDVGLQRPPHLCCANLTFPRCGAAADPLIVYVQSKGFNFIQFSSCDLFQTFTKRKANKYSVNVSNYIHQYIHISTYIHRKKKAYNTSRQIKASAMCAACLSAPSAAKESSFPRPKGTLGPGGRRVSCTTPGIDADLMGRRMYHDLSGLENIHIYIYMHACMYVCMYVSMFACMYVCMYVCM